MHAKFLLSSCVLATTGGLAAADPAVGPADSAAAAPSETSVHYTVEATSVSSYVWRGSLLSADRATPAVQPYGEIDIDIPKAGNGRLAVGVWTSRFVTGDTTAQEIDPYVWYQQPIGDFLVRAGYTVYVLPDADPKDAMHELLGQVSWLATPTLTAFTGVAVDPIRTKGAYGFAGATYARTFGASTLTATGNVGGSRYEMQPADLQDVTLTVREQYAVGDAGFYLAATGATTYSGRERTMYPYLGLSVGITK